MDPTTVIPPSPTPSQPQQNPDTPINAVIEASSTLDRFQKGEPGSSRNMNNFKSLVFKLAGRLSPANRSVVERRLDDIVPHELLVPDHPPYDYMILTALWELKAEGGSSEEDISHFIENEYHELPWAHATILNHHLRDLCKKGKITMTHDRCYIRCSSIKKPKPSDSPSPSPSPSSSPSSSPCSSPLLSSYSSSSTSFCTSPSSSSSSLSWGGSNRRRKGKKNKRRGKMVQLRSRDRGRGRGSGSGRGRGSGSGRGRGRGVWQLRNVNGQIAVEERNEVEEPKQGTEDQNEVTSMEVEACSIKDGDLPDVSANISEEENMPCEKNNKEQSRPQKGYNVTWIGRRARKLTEDEIDFLNGQFGDEVPELEVDVSNAKIDEHVEQLEQKEAEIDTLNVQSDDEVTELEVDAGYAEVDEDVEQTEQKEEKGATDMELEHRRQEEIQQSDIVERRTLGEEQLMDDVNLSKEQDLVMMQCEAQVTTACVEKQLGDPFKEQNQPEENEEECVGKPENSDKQLVCLTKEQVATKAQSVDLHDDDVTEKQPGDTFEEQFNPAENKEGCGKNTEESNKQLNCLTKEQVDTKAQSVDLHDDDVAEKKHSDTFEEQNKPAENKEECGKNTEEVDKELDRLTKEQVEEKAQSVDLHDVDDCKDDDVTEEPVHPEKQCVEKTEESLKSCEEAHKKNAEAESAEQEVQQTDVIQKEIMSAEVQQEPFVKLVEQQNQPCIQQSEMSEKDSLQEKTNPVRNEESSTSSGSTTEGSRRPLRQGLRSSSKKEDAAPKSDSKKQLELVTPVRRSLRSNKTISEAAALTEVPDQSKEQVTYSGRTRSSKRKTEIAEAEQVLNPRKTRRTGL